MTEKTRIHWSVGLTEEMPGRTSERPLIESRLLQYFNEVASSDTAVEIGWQAHIAPTIGAPYQGMLTDVHMIDAMQKAIDDGADAVITGPHWDPGLWLARQALSVPVIGPGESAMMLASAIGTHFAVITVSDVYVPHLESAILRYGYAPHAIERPARRFGMSYENFVAALKGEDDTFVREFERSALEAIADGANVIIAGGQLFGPVFQQWDYQTIADTGVPIIDVGAAAIKIAEAMMSMRRVTQLQPSQSTTSPFRRSEAGEDRTARATLTG